MESNGENDPPSSSSAVGSKANRHSAPIRSRRSSSRIDIRSSSGPRNRPNLRGRISKGGSIPRRSVKNSAMREVTNKISQEKIPDSHDRMDDDQPVEDGNIQTDPANFDSDPENSCAASVASADTVIEPSPSMTKTKGSQVMKHFTYINSNGKYKCSICNKEYKAHQYSDSNLRSHLGFTHGMREFLFPSQMRRAPGLRRKTKIAPILKKKLDLAAIQCILDDGHAFGLFRRPGMQQFLDVLLPGYHGPTRKTVKNHLRQLYKQHRSSLRDQFEKIEHLSLTLDLWRNSRRTYFLVITAHYYDDAMEYKSGIISFRRFPGRHLGKRLELFIMKEIKKLNIGSKVMSVTTDSGSDVKAATSNNRFGTRFSCMAHDINLTISTGLALWKLPKSSSSKQPPPPPTTTTTAAATMSTLNYEMEEEASDQLRLIDDDDVSDDDYDDASEHSDVDDFDSLSLEDGNGASSSSDSSSESEEESGASAAQRERQIDDQHQQEVQRLVSSKEELQKKILLVLKRVRRLISMIHKSQALTSFVRNEANRHQINIDAMGSGEQNETINELVKDFHVRWSSTYLMLTRLIAARKIVNEMTHSLPNRDRLTMKKLEKLKALSFSHLDWELLQALANILAPFHLATVCLSGRQYPTLSLSYWIEQNLRVYLSTDVPNMPLENALRCLLLDKFEFYFDTKMKAEQKHAKLIAAYLDPFTLNEMSIDEIKIAESLLMDEMKNGKKTANVSRTAQQSSAASSTSKKDSKTTLPSTIQKFKISCNNAVSLGSLSQVAPPSKELSLKEEISMYLSKCKASNDWQGFWNDNQRSMPLLASFVRRYGIIPATSVASESAFSVAGYLHRKQRSSLSPSTLRYLMVLKKSW